MSRLDKQEQFNILVFRLKAVVLALGESTTPPWWQTKFMNETGLKYLERLYPRSFFHAAVYAAGRAASEAHERAVGRVGVYHLFRLPESLEAELVRLPLHTYQDFLSELRGALGQSERLMEMLASLCGDEKVGSSLGARRVGSDKDLLTRAGLRKAAAIYHAAFRMNQPGFPYFTAEPTESRG
jgi:hypothetical protein